MLRPQFTLRSLLVAMLVVAAFFVGIHFERKRRRHDEVSRRSVPAVIAAPTAATRGKIEDTYDKFDHPQHIDKMMPEIRLSEPEGISEWPQ